MNNIFKNFSNFILTLIIKCCAWWRRRWRCCRWSCWRGPVPTCTDNAPMLIAEYNYMGNVEHIWKNCTVWVQFVQSAAYARGATGDGQLIAVLDSGISVGSGSTTDLNQINANIATFLTGSDVVNVITFPKMTIGTSGSSDYKCNSGHGSMLLELLQMNIITAWWSWNSLRCNFTHY